MGEIRAGRGRGEKGKWGVGERWSMGESRAGRRKERGRRVNREEGRFFKILELQ